MSESNYSQQQEIEALWAEVFGEAPAVHADAQMLADVMIRHLPPAPPYGDPLAWRDREPLPSAQAPDQIGLSARSR